MTLESFCGQNNVRIIFASYTTKVKGFVTLDDDCGTMIVINNRFSPESQKKTLEHELIHLLVDHLHRPEEAALLEAEVHEMTEKGYSFAFD